MRKKGDQVSVDGLRWFASKDEQRIFDERRLACVYAIGPVGGRPVKFGWCLRPDERLDKVQAQHWEPLRLHAISWLAGEAMAIPLDVEVKRILDKAGKRIRFGWFDVTAEYAGPTIAVASRNLGLTAISHDAMMQDIADEKDRRIRKALREAGL